MVAIRPDGDSSDTKPASEAPPQNLLAEPRRRRILEWLREEGSARVRDLSHAFGVSEATIRQDLERLDSDGHVVREHGGAYLRTLPQQVQSMSLRHVSNIDRKQKIGRAVASLVGNGESIILDAGSTTTEIANNLKAHQDLNIITNAINIALLLGGLPGLAVHLSGGLFKATTLSVIGEKSGDFFEGIHAENSSSRLPPTRSMRG